MVEYLEQFWAWLMSLGEEHDVNPLVLGGLYFTSKLCFFTLLGWVIKNMRAKKPFMVQLLFACLAFSLPYMYIIIAGKNISVWIYIFIGCVYSYGTYTIYKKVTQKAMPDVLP